MLPTYILPTKPDLFFTTVTSRLSIDYAPISCLSLHSSKHWSFDPTPIKYIHPTTHLSQSSQARFVFVALLLQTFPETLQVSARPLLNFDFIKFDFCPIGSDAHVFIH
jgi:hypothetical protein